MPIPHLSTIRNNNKLVLSAVILCVLGGVFTAWIFLFSEPEQVDHLEALPATSLKWVEIATDTRAVTNGREQLNVIIAVAPEETQANQDNILSTVMQVAVIYQQKSRSPIVAVKLVAELDTAPEEAHQLAYAVFIPDKQGYDGKQAIGPWDKLMAAERLLTVQECDYLHLWSELKESFMTNGELTPEGKERLDQEISRLLNIEPNSLDPFANSMVPVDL